MNAIGRSAAAVKSNILEILLVLSTSVIVLQLCWPTIAHAWRAPAPGRIGFDNFTADCLADELLIKLPRTYHSKGMWPLVIYLHGSGHRGNNPDRLRCEPVFERLNIIVAAPQCLTGCLWPSKSIAGLVEHIASHYQVDRTRVYLIGHSMGAYGAWSTAAAFPDLFAAIVPISDGGDIRSAPSLVHLRIWAFHGEKDRTIPAIESKRMVDAIRHAGGQPRLTIIPGAGHAISESVCKRSELWDWLLQTHL